MKTRFTAQTGVEIRQVTPGQWQHVDTNDGRGAQVGPAYRTKDEALADHEGYLHRGGWLRAAHICRYCGAASNREPSEQESPADYCHAEDHA